MTVGTNKDLKEGNLKSAKAANTGPRREDKFTMEKFFVFVVDIKELTIKVDGEQEECVTSSLGTIKQGDIAPTASDVE